MGRKAGPPLARSGANAARWGIPSLRIPQVKPWGVSTDEVLGHPLLAVDVDDADTHLCEGCIHDVPTMVAWLERLGHHVVVVGVDAIIQPVAARRADILTPGV